MECRRALVRGESCDEHPGAHADLAIKAQESALVKRVWGDSVVTRHSVPLGAKIIIGMAISGSFFGIIHPIFVVFSTVIPLIALPFLMARDKHNVRGKQRMLRPEGVTPMGALPSRQLSSGRPVVGVVQEVPESQQGLSPLKQKRCVAFTITLRNEQAGDSPILFRDGRTVGFQILASDGSTIEIPAGPIWVLARGDEADPFAARGYLSDVDPGQKRRNIDPFPFDTAHESIIRVGDPVAVHGSLRPVPTTHQARGLYREGADTVLVPTDPVPLIDLSPASK